MNKKQFQIAIKARGKKLYNAPRQQQPDAIRRRYKDRIKGGPLEDAIDLVREHVVPSLERFAENASHIAKHDAKKDLGDTFETVRNKFADKWTRKNFEKVVFPIAQDTERWNRDQLNKQLKPALGVNVLDGSEPWLQGAMTEFTTENVALIRSIPTTFFSDLESTLSREIADGTRWEDLAVDIEERYGVAQSRAELIARDQVGKFNGDLNKVRQQDLGIESFTWQTMHDERVREEHVARDGQEYSWTEGADGEFPGQPINCRCFAAPLLGNLLE